MRMRGAAGRWLRGTTSKTTEVTPHLKERIVATTVKALAATAGERPATMAATPEPAGTRKGECKCE